MMRRIFFTLLIIFSLAAGLSSCGHKAPPKAPTAPPEEAKV